MFQVVCAHTRVWGCGAMLACVVRPPHHTEPHHTVLHPSHRTAPITPHRTSPCRRALLAGRAEELVAALVFLPGGGAGRWRALCRAECKPSAAMGSWTACCHFAGEQRGAGSPQLLGLAGQREACLLQQPAQSYRHGFAGSCVW